MGRTPEEGGLYALRVSRGLTQDQLACLAGVDTATISRVERGLQRLRPVNVVALSKALRVKTSKITQDMPDE